MTDKEMLEYAAKAAGVDSDRLKNRYDHWDKDHAPVLVGRAWNPLTDDGDALRPADALRDGTYLLSVERAATEAELRRLVVQRDALLEALRPFAAADLTSPTVRDTFGFDVLHARAAISAVEGGGK